jgi:hypothetical protein
MCNDPVMEDFKNSIKEGATERATLVFEAVKIEMEALRNDDRAFANKINKEQVGEIISLAKRRSEINDFDMPRFTESQMNNLEYGRKFGEKLGELWAFSGLRYEMENEKFNIGERYIFAIMIKMYKNLQWKKHVVKMKENGAII